MSKKRRSDNTLGIAIAIAVVVVGLVLLAAMRVRLPGSPRGETVSTAKPQVVIRQIEQEDVEHLDRRPLFLPTAINCSDPTLPSGLRREPGSVFKAVAPKMTFNEDEMKIALPVPIAVPADAVQAMQTGQAPMPYFSFGSINYPYTPLTARLAYLEVLQAKTGRVVLAVSLAAQPADKFPTGDWKPLEMVVAVEAAGMVGEPMVTSGSESEDVDNFFRAFIAKQFRLGARLPPGFYTLRIGP